jgi:hypothetical protein
MSCVPRPAVFSAKYVLPHIYLWHARSQIKGDLAPAVYELETLWSRTRIVYAIERPAKAFWRLNHRCQKQEELDIGALIMPLNYFHCASTFCICLDCRALDKVGLQSSDDWPIFI